MFDFTNVREITSKMHEDSLAYAKNFWQKIFDSLKYDKKHRVENVFKFVQGNTSLYKMPVEADPSDCFEGLSIEIIISYSGKITIEIEWKKDEFDSQYYKSLLRDALLLNGFYTHRSNENLYSYEINQT